MTLAAGGTVNVLDIPAVLLIRKAATQSVVNSATLVNDADLTITLSANKTYRVDFFPAVTASSAAADVKFAWAVTGGVAGLGTRSCMGPQIGTTDVTNGAVRMSRHNLTTAIGYGHDGTNTPAIFESFLVETTTSGTSGTLTCQWAQNTASGGVTTSLSTSSYFTVTEVV